MKRPFNLLFTLLALIPMSSMADNRSVGMHMHEEPQSSAHKHTGDTRLASDARLKSELAATKGSSTKVILQQGRVLTDSDMNEAPTDAHHSSIELTNATVSSVRQEHLSNPYSDGN